jgi:hypothetical protein
MADNTKSPDDATYDADNSVRDARTGALKKLGPNAAKLNDLADVESRARLGSTAGKGLGAKGNTAGLPKRADFDTQDLWIEAVRKFRANQSEKPEANTAAEGRKRALGRMP